MNRSRFAAVRRALTTLVGALFIVGGIGSAFAEVVRFSIFAINDFHGNIQASDPVPGYTREHRRPLGGAAYLSGHLAHHSSGKQYTFVGVGDLIGASPLISSLTEDQATFSILSGMGLQISALGNHELDRGFQWLSDQYKLNCQHNRDSKRCLFDGFDSLKIRYLAANVTLPEHLPKVFAPYVVEERNGMRLAFVGLVTQDTPKLVVPTGIRGLVFHDEIDALRKTLKALEREAIDVVVVLLHEGGVVSGLPSTTVADRTANCSMIQGNLRRILDQLPSRVDVLLTGHTHKEYICEQNNALVVQGVANGTRLSEITLQFDTKTRKLVEKRAVNHLVTQEPAFLDHQVSRTVELARQQTEVFARAAVVDGVPSVTRARLPDSESSVLGNLIADLMYRYGVDHGVDVALINAGSLRSDLSPKEGQMTFGDLFSVQPFGNDWVAVTLTGEQILTALRQQWEGRRDGRPRFMQVSESFEVRYKANGASLEVESVRIKGMPVLPQGQYRVMINSFMFAGGDGFDIFAKGVDPIVLGRDIDLLQQSARANIKTIIDQRKIFASRVSVR